MIRRLSSTLTAYLAGNGALAHIVLFYFIAVRRQGMCKEGHVCLCTICLNRGSFLLRGRMFVRELKTKKYDE